MANFKPEDNDFEVRVRNSFARQKMMETIHARLTHVKPGVVEIELPFQERLTQQHGFLHAGAIATIADSACGYAALSLAPARAAVLTIEYKINLLAPAVGERLVARGRVVRPGQTITVCDGDIFAQKDGNKKLIAKMVSTIMILRDRDDLRD
jgi:uncharacterized protein (TIGR00369 family)